MQQIAESKAKLAEKTSELARDLGAEQESEKKDKKPGEAKSSDAQGSDDEKSDGKPGDGKSADKPKPTGRSRPSPPMAVATRNRASPATASREQGNPAIRPQANKSLAIEPGEEKPSDDKPAGEKSADEKPGDEQPGESGGSKSADGQDSSGGSESEQKPGGKPKPGQGSPGQPGEPSDGNRAQGDTKPDDQSPDEGDSGSTRPPGGPGRTKNARGRAEAGRRAAAAGGRRSRKRPSANWSWPKPSWKRFLRQLREEEIGRTLAMLESRFRKMLETAKPGQHRHQAARQDSRGPSAITTTRSRPAGSAGRRQLIVEEADKALAVLHDEGSAVAFPEAVSDLRDDMEQVVVRLAQAKVDAMTQGIEDDIVVSLEEMIAAFHKAQKQVEAQRRPGGRRPGIAARRRPWRKSR